MTDPEVSVLMPVYNGERYLREAINSIINQTFQNFEFHIINDGSTDKSHSILRSINDPRIIVHEQRNKGLPFSLNKAIRLSQGEYIARMDADDISMPNRLEIQKAFLDSNPEIGLCGSWVIKFGNGKEEIKELPIYHNDIFAHFLFTSLIPHPSIMVRREILKQFGLCYNEKLFGAEDIDLWIRLAKRTMLYNIPVPLLKYRTHLSQKSVNKQELLNKDIYSVIGNLLSRLRIDLKYQDFLILRKSWELKQKFSQKEIQDLFKICLFIYRRNLRYKVFENKALLRTLLFRCFCALRTL